MVISYGGAIQIKEALSQKLSKFKYSGNHTNLSEIYTAISRKVVEKKVHATIPKGNKGYDESGAPNGNFRENICSEDDLRTRIFGTFVVKFIACLPLLRFSNIYKVV